MCREQERKESETKTVMPRWVADSQPDHMKKNKDVERARVKKRERKNAEAEMSPE